MTPQHVKQGAHSITITGLVITLASALAQIFDLDIGLETLTNLVTSSGMLIGIAISWYGRVRTGDITWYGRRLNV